MADNINEVVAPSLNILIKVWEAKPELCEMSDIFSSKVLD